MIEIVKWNKVFENSNSRKRIDLLWFQCPTGCDSSGWIELMALGRPGLQAVGVFQGLCQATAKFPQDRRGRFVKKNGQHMDLDYIAMLTKIPKQFVWESLQILADENVAWIVFLDDQSSASGVADDQQDDGSQPDSDPDLGPDSDPFGDPKPTEPQSSADDLPTICQSSADDLPTICQSSADQSPNTREVQKKKKKTSPPRTRARDDEKSAPETNGTNRISDHIERILATAGINRTIAHLSEPERNDFESRPYIHSQEAVATICANLPDHLIARARKTNRRYCVEFLLKDLNRLLDGSPCTDHEPGKGSVRTVEKFANGGW